MSGYFDRHPFQALLAAVLVVGGIIAAIVVAIASDNPNYAGTGNAFDITATVTGHTDSSIFVDQVAVNSAEGLATNWFQTQSSWWSGDGNHAEIHNNYNDSSLWSSRHTVGVVYNLQGSPISVQSLTPGTHVRVIGAIRSNYASKANHNRAVFTAVTIVDQSSSY